MRGASLQANVVCVMLLAAAGGAAFGEAAKPLVVTGVFPASCQIGKVAEAEIRGSGFVEGVNVFIGETKLPQESVKFLSPRRLHVTLPERLEVCVLRVKVTSPDGQTTYAHGRKDKPVTITFDTLSSVVWYRVKANARRLWLLAKVLDPSGKTIIVILVILSIAAAAFSIHCLFLLRASRVLPRAFVDEVSTHLSQGHIDAAMYSCQRRDCALARVVSAGLSKAGQAPQKILAAIESAGSREASRLRQKVTYLNDIAVLAPMLGLLGTVFGMILGFNVLGEDVQSARHMLLAAAISTAMVTTAAGLIVGIPTMGLYFFFRGRVLKLVTSMETAAESVADAIIAVGGEDEF